MVLLAAHQFGVQVPRVRWKLYANQRSRVPKASANACLGQPIHILIETKGFDAVNLALPQVDREAACSQQRLNMQF
jgi:hypothetical protein